MTAHVKSVDCPIMPFASAVGYKKIKNTAGVMASNEETMPRPQNQSARTHLFIPVAFSVKQAKVVMDTERKDH
jgi:hypothetical protein